MYATAFIMGFLVGRVTMLKSYVHYMNEDKNKEDTKRVAKKTIMIDDKKFVTNVSTDALEKKGKDLGVKILADDNVQSSVVKLSQFKKNK